MHVLPGPPLKTADTSSTDYQRARGFRVLAVFWPPKKLGVGYFTANSIINMFT